MRFATSNLSSKLVQTASRKTGYMSGFQTFFVHRWNHHVEKLQKMLLAQIRRWFGTLPWSLPFFSLISQLQLSLLITLYLFTIHLEFTISITEYFWSQHPLRYRCWSLCCISGLWTTQTSYSTVKLYDIQGNFVKQMHCYKILNARANVFEGPATEWVCHTLLKCRASVGRRNVPKMSKLAGSVQCLLSNISPGRWRLHSLFLTPSIRYTGHNIFQKYKFSVGAAFHQTSS